MPDGTTSNPYVVATSTSDSWASEAATAHRRGTQRLLDVRTVDPADDVREALRLAEGERVVERGRLMLLDDVPVEIAQSFYPAWLAAGSALAERARIKGGAVAVLAALGHPAVEVLERVTARGPDAYEIGNLHVPLTEPILVLTRISYDAGGRPVEYAVNRMIAARSAPLSYRLRVAPA